jgi:hypothetical protein
MRMEQLYLSGQLVPPQARDLVVGHYRMKWLLLEKREGHRAIVRLGDLHTEAFEQVFDRLAAVRPVFNQQRASSN